ncbi:hypothetical protein [Deinococcus budaensis]|uniref:Cation transport ATPase n=1 Tax=Deinococcus budaensis TaxID=1665626 RepID=A0A7W8GHZ7_9DEIO|nr:hypothetical protein [Deinococcus budaensis]MBB5235982.1 cation transport ATPase [Deinococcus budaensis]
MPESLEPTVPRRQLHLLLYGAVFLIVFVVPGGAALLARSVSTLDPLLAAALAEVVAIFVFLLALRRLR